MIVDNFSGHVPSDDLQNIKVINFEPNLTSHVQPADQGIIRCFKAHYRSQYTPYDSGITPGEIYDINQQVEAMWLTEAAWQEVDTMTIWNCWAKAGILLSFSSTTATDLSIPISLLIHNADPQTDPVLHAEHQLQAALDDLESTGCLQHANRMDIEGLLNPIDESTIIGDTTDIEIYQAVMNAQSAQEQAPTNGGDDDTDNCSPDEPCPMCHEVLIATTVFKKYLDLESDPLAQKLLDSFKYNLHIEESRSMRSTHITSYFSLATPV